MAFWWPLMVLALAYAICIFIFMLIPHNVPSIDVDVSDVLEDGSQMKENNFIYVPPRGRTQQADLKVQCYKPTTMKHLGYFPSLTPVGVSDVVYFSGLRSVGSDAVVDEGCDGRWNKLGEKELMGATKLGGATALSDCGNDGPGLVWWWSGFCAATV